MGMGYIWKGGKGEKRKIREKKYIQHIKENTKEKEKTNAERREGDSWASSL
jgi:hypothetical protein